jgi:hypothetical protein
MAGRTALSSLQLFRRGAVQKIVTVEALTAALTVTSRRNVHPRKLLPG